MGSSMYSVYYKQFCLTRAYNEGCREARDTAKEVPSIQSRWVLCPRMGFYPEDNTAGEVWF